MSDILTVKGLCKSFSNENTQQHVLKNMDITIRKGDFTIIMGNSGSGKSTLLYALSGMDRPTLGSVRYMGEEITQYSNDRLAVFRRRNCGFVFQQNLLNESMSVMDNIMVSGLLVSKMKKDIYQKGTELLKKMDMGEECHNKFPSQLSGGEAQRVAIVRAMINSPQILFADEPTGALNSKNTNHVLDIMTELNRDGQSVIMVTHDVRSARRGNRILYLKDGVIIDECDMGAYFPNDQKRHERLKGFLEKMGW